MIGSGFISRSNSPALTSSSSSSSYEVLPVVLCVPIKKTRPLKFGPSLLDYINNAYAEDTAKYKEDCCLLDKLREEAIIQLPEVIDIAAIDRLFMYYCQLAYLGSRFPLDVGLEYSWYPAFEVNGKLVKRSNLNFEKASVLFTIGAGYSQLGSTETRISTEGIRKACSYYQYAAGCFKYIARELIPDLRSAPPNDLSIPILESLVSLMLAQAQECMWQKAVMEHMKHGTIARLAIKVADFFDNILEKVTSSSNQDQQQPSPPSSSSLGLPDDWIRHIELKSSYFKAVAQYHKANECISMSKYGEEIARLRIAKIETNKALDGLKILFENNNNNLSQLITGGFTIITSMFISSTGISNGQPQSTAIFIDEVRHLLSAIDRDLVRAEKDNNLVYLESVPDENQLPPILRSDMVKPNIPTDVLDPAYWKRMSHVEIQRPLFGNLVPFAVHQAASVYNDKKEMVVQHDIIAKCNELQLEYNELIKKLDLPTTLDKVDPDHIPQSLISCAEEVHHDGGGQALRDMLLKIQQMSVKNSDLVEEGFNILEEENESDDILRRQYGTLWNRPPSQQLTSTLLAQGSQYHDTLQAALKADRIVRAKVTNWGKAIDVLSLPVENIIKTLPNLVKENGEQQQDGSNDIQQIFDLIQRLRVVLQDGQDEYKQQQQLSEDVQALSDKDDISDALVAKSHELTGGSPIVKIEPEQFTDVFTKELKKYETMQGTALQLLNNHADRRIKMEQLFEQFIMAISTNNIVAQREKAIFNLEQAFTKFKEIRTNLVEGIKFYSQYTDTLTQFRDDCNDFALGRKMEASELSRNHGAVVRRR